MKKAILFIFIILFLAMLARCGGNKVDDSEQSIYNGTVYDVAYYLSKRDGLRARANYYYVFSESEKKVVYMLRLTAGAGKTTIKEGTYEGSLDDKVKITMNDDTVIHFTFENNSMYDEADVYSSKSVRSAISDIKRYSNK